MSSEIENDLNEIIRICNNPFYRDLESGFIHNTLLTTQEKLYRYEESLLYIKEYAELIMKRINDVS